MIDQGKYYFLSRPRRFGKSLFLDTLKELFEGNEPLFKGLFIHDPWDWSSQCPVLRISFGGGVVASRQQLDQRLADWTRMTAKEHGLVCESTTTAGCFAELIAHVHAQTGQRVIVLVDEYDKPILDRIEQPDIARDIREGLKDFYSVIKDSDAHIRFAFLTGVSKFSKVSLFSGLNNLEDITLDERYSTICGYTDEDVDTVFAPELEGLDREEIRRWYNGYNWLGESVYNPFDLLFLFGKRKFGAYWFETGTPALLVKLLLGRQVNTPDLTRIHASEALLSTFDVDTMAIEALMFQTGYLTIGTARYRPGAIDIILRYPNLEVEASLNQTLLTYLTQTTSDQAAQTSRLYDLLQANDFGGLRELFHAFYASIPHDWYRKNELARYEGY